MEGFTTHFEENYEKIVDTFSNSNFDFTTERIEEWIESQHTLYRKHICRVLLDNTYYYSFADTLYLLNEATQSFLTKNSSNVGNEDKQIVILTSKVGSNKPGSSLFMFGILGYRILVDNGINPERIIVSQGFTNIDLENKENYIFVKFDDFSYSGSQLNQSYKKLKKDGIELHTILCGMSSTSLKQKFIRENNENIHRGVVVDSFEDMLKEGELSEEDYYGLRYFFRPMNKLQISVFFSHKMADYPSTIANIPIYGPVIPKNYYPEMLKTFDLGGMTLTAIDWDKYPELRADKVFASQNNTQSDFSFTIFTPGCEEILRNITDNMKSYYPIVFDTSYLFKNYNEGKDEEYKDVLESSLVFRELKEIGNDLERQYEWLSGFKVEGESPNTLDLLVEDMFANIKYEKDENGEMKYIIMGKQIQFDFYDYFNDLKVIYDNPRCPTAYYKTKGFFKGMTTPQTPPSQGGAKRTMRRRINKRRIRTQKYRNQKNRTRRRNNNKSMKKRLE